MMHLEKINTRHWFVSLPGHLKGACDYKNQEMLNAGALSGDENILKGFRLERDYDLGLISTPVDPQGNPYEDPGVDLHLVAASSLSPYVKDLFQNYPWLCNKKDSTVADFRQKGKILNFSNIYGAQAANISLQLGCTIEEAQQFIDAYFSYPDGFWKLGAWLKAIALLAEQTRWTRLPGGALLFVNEDNAKGSGDRSAAQRKATNGQVQGFSSIQSKLALIYTSKEFERLDRELSELVGERRSGVTAVVHDEIVSVFPGDCYTESTPDKHGYVKHKFSFDPEVLALNKEEWVGFAFRTKDVVLREHALGLIYGTALKDQMEAAMTYTFNTYLEKDIPAKAVVEIGKYWIH